MLKTFKAPWTEAEVKALNATQNASAMHPFTCANRSNGKHVYYNGDLGALIATKGGWVCLSCDYTQNWAYEMMLEQWDPLDGLLTRP